MPKHPNPHCYRSHLDCDAHVRRLHSYRNFTDYIAAQREYIATYRGKAELPCSADVVEMNTPFEIRPKNFDGKRGVLLIHGFMGSPYQMRAMGEFYAKQGFLVRAILLPGHGTRPGDLLRAELTHWQTAVEYGIHSLSYDCDDIHLCGFSLGATLAYLTSRKYDIKTLCLLAPAFGISRLSILLPFLATLSKLPFFPFLRWNNQVQEDNWAMYNAFPMVSAWQVAKAVKQAKRQLQQHGINIPSFFAASVDDATVKFTAIQTAFQRCQNNNKHLVAFSKNLNIPTLDKMSIVDSRDAKHKILDLSHVGLPISPTDSYFGDHGCYYEQDGNNYTYGEMLIGHEKQHQHFRRLTYNPHFNEMTDKLTVFLKNKN